MIETHVTRAQVIDAKRAIPKLTAIMDTLLGPDVVLDQADACRNARIDALTAIDTMLAFAYATVGRASMTDG